MAEKTEALVKVENFQALAIGEKDLHQIIQANFAGRQISADDLDKIRVPAGGGLYWTIPGLEKDTTREEIYGVVVYRQTIRRYWAEKYTGAGLPPDCISDNCILGRGEPAGDCTDCPYAQFGSALDAKGEPGAGQACKVITLVFAYLPDGLLPSKIVLPPTSMLPFEKYCNRLTTHGIALHATVTGFRLEAAKSRGGITYSRVLPILRQRLNPEQVALIRRRVLDLRGIFSSCGATEVQQEDVE